jgi:histidyl-tRNA synthetase
MKQTFKHHIKAEETAKHYGFHPFTHVTVEKQDLGKVKNFKDSKKLSMSDKGAALNFDNLLEEKIALMRFYIEKKMTELPQPPMICYTGPLHGNPHYTGHGTKIFNMDIIGNSKSIAEAIMIETAYVILRENLKEDEELTIEINSIGDKDSFARFTREFTAFCRKHMNELPPAWKQSLKKDPFSLFSCDEETCSVLIEEAPKPMTYLSEQSRDHFKEVLEFIESLNLPYTINHSLIGSKHYSSGTIFRIVKTNKQNKKEILAIGERYNTVSRKAWGKKEIPALGASILIDEKTLKKTKESVVAKNSDSGKKIKPARFFFIQLGYDAKLKNLSIIEMLRVANIPVHQSLSRDKITSQLAAAEKLAVPYILILGQKEAIEESVTVRHIHTRVQETIRITELITYLKRLP